jgi:Aspartyl protease
VIIRGRFIGSAPYFAVRLRSAHFQGRVWLLADTGASRTTLLDRDVRLLGISAAALTPTSMPVVGVGGSVRSFQARAVDVTLASDAGDWVVQQDIWVVRHDLQRLPPDEVARILRLPSVLGRDLINQFHFACDYWAGIVELSRV